MLLTQLIKNALRNRGDITPGLPAPADSRPAVLNVGGGSKQIGIPAHYEGWSHLLLDIAPGPDVDVVLDARRLDSLDAGQFDAIYCSHNLEHYYWHDCERVLSGFAHALKHDGYAEIRVPDMAAVFAAMVRNGMDIEDILYTSGAGPISIHDVIYGWRVEIERSGVDFYAHKRGFTVKTLTAALQRAGFAKIMTATAEGGYEIRALAFKAEPTPAQASRLGL